MDSDVNKPGQRYSWTRWQIPLNYKAKTNWEIMTINLAYRIQSIKTLPNSTTNGTSTMKLCVCPFY